MAANYVVANITATSITLHVVPDANYRYYRVFARLANDANDVSYDRKHILSQPQNVVIDNLWPGTSYAINVGYSSTGEDNSYTWIGTQIQQTEEEQSLVYGFALLFDANGGQSAPSPVVVSEQISEPNTSLYLTTTISSSIPSRTDYVFSGWSMSEDGSGKLYHPGESFTAYATMDPFPMYTLYAVWEEETPYKYVWMYLRGQYINGTYVSGWVRTIPWIYTGRQWHATIPWVYTNRQWHTTA